MPAVLALYLGRKRPHTVAACASAWWRTWLFLSKVTLGGASGGGGTLRDSVAHRCLSSHGQHQHTPGKGHAGRHHVALHGASHELSPVFTVVQLLAWTTSRSDCVSEESVSDAIRFSVEEVLAGNQLGRLLVAEPRMALLTSRDTETGAS